MSHRTDMTFYNFSTNDTEKILNWSAEHLPECKYKDNTGAIGGVLTFSFTPTSIGTVVKVICACGEELDLTEYDLW